MLEADLAEAGLQPARYLRSIGPGENGTGQIAPEEAAA